LSNTRPDDVLLNKSSILERCLRRILEEYAMCPDLDNFTHVDALTLNLQRACQAVIDMAMHTVAGNRLGLPQSSGHAFRLLADAGRIPGELAISLQKMVGFRNIAIHNYQTLDKAVLSYIVKNGFQDFTDFCKALGIRIHVDPVSGTAEGPDSPSNNPG
jgi:uncharacterized protein YutE (UPF0331/DUF86 family)